MANEGTVYTLKNITENFIENGLRFGLSANENAQVELLIVLIMAISQNLVNRVSHSAKE